MDHVSEILQSPAVQIKIRRFLICSMIGGAELSGAIGMPGRDPFSLR